LKKIIFLSFVFLTVWATSSDPVASAMLPYVDDGIRSVIVPHVPAPSGQPQQFKADCALYGFSIDEQRVPYSGTTFRKNSYQRFDGGHLQYQTNIQQVLLKNINNVNTFSVVYRVVTSPVGRRDWGFLGIGSHSDTWYTRVVNSYANLGSNKTMGQWAPKNEYANFSGTIGIGVDSSGPSISASVNFSIDQLSVVSRTNVASNYYETDYDILWDNNYNLYSAEYLGFFAFARTNSTVSPTFSVAHRVSYFGSQWFGLETATYHVSL
jgi:hypothetical protein